MDLVQLWRGIYEEAVQLADVVEQLPDDCECGDGDGHLAGACPCCGGRARESAPGQATRDCHGMLARLRADLAMLSEDLAATGAPLEAAALAGLRFELRRGVFLAAADVQRVADAFRRTTEAVAGFQRECVVSRMQAVKRACAELRDDCARVDTDLREGFGLSRGRG